MEERLSNKVTVFGSYNQMKKLQNFIGYGMVMGSGKNSILTFNGAALTAKLNDYSAPKPSNFKK